MAICLFPSPGGYRPHVLAVPGVPQVPWLRNRRGSVSANESLALPAWAAYRKLPVKDGGITVLEFHGELAGEVDNDSGDRLRWAHLQLWRVIDTDTGHDNSLPEGNPWRGRYGQPVWLLYTIGHSLVVHDGGNECNRGIRVKAADFPRHNADHQDLVPCPECEPSPWEGNPEGMYMVETTWYTDIMCPDWDAVLTALSKCANCGDRAHPSRACRCGCRSFTRGGLTSPGQRLVEQVTATDPQVAALMNRTRRI